eukprot:Seg599.7 transcript_id=Seg599.7/GoldUCD/mRNA.D3Y31 product="hypothetical protein" protein_id=Seg599.7/GoldUCD/D3Y31
MMLARSCGRSVQCGSRLLVQGRGIWKANAVGWSQRSEMSLLPEKSENNAVESDIGKSKFSIPQHYPSRLDRMTLIVTRTMKAEDIGSEVSRDVMEKANTKRRIMANMSLMIFALCGSIVAIALGKKAMETDNIYEINKRR